MPVDVGQLDKVLAQIKKAYGDGASRWGDQQDPVARISTGSLELDYATNGGFPIGRWSHIYGGYMSGKTLTCWNLIKRAQAMGMTCAYYNIEKQYDREWVAARGVDVKNLLLVEGTDIEGVGGKLEALLGSVHFHVLDSLAAAVSLDMLAAKPEDQFMGLGARTWGRMIQRCHNRFDDHQNTIVMVNQVRDVFGRGGGEAPPGGKSIDFISSLSMHYRRSSWLFKDEDGILDPEGKKRSTLSDDAQPDGLEFQIRVIKSRVGPPLRTARLRLDFETGEFDDLWSVAKAAAHFNVIETTSPGRFVLPDGTKIHGKKKLREALSEDKKLREAVRQAMNGR